MSKALATLVAVALGGVAVGADAGGRGYRGGGAHHAGPPGGAYVGARPYWRGVYWGPRIGIYYGAPGYWAGWPYAWAATPYPYWVAPAVVGAVAAPLVYTPPVQPPADDYWYYCTRPAGYFPYVQDCEQPWLKVLPQTRGESGAPRLAP